MSFKQSTQRQDKLGDIEPDAMRTKECPFILRVTLSSQKIGGENGARVLLPPVHRILQLIQPELLLFCATGEHPLDDP